VVGLEKITDKIIADANARAQAIISDAEQKCAEIELAGEQKKKAFQAQTEEAAFKECENIKMRAKSGIAMSRRDKILSLRANLIDAAFENAVQYILALDGDSYRQMFSSLMAKVMCDRVESEQDSMRLYGEDISSQKYEVLMNKKDKDTHGKAIIEGARRAIVGKLSTQTLDKIVLSDKNANIEGGFIIKCGDVELNCSIRTLVEGIRPKLEAQVATVLFAMDASDKN